jgi:hypothetical protein
MFLCNENERRSFAKTRSGQTDGTPTNGTDTLVRNLVEILVDGTTEVEMEQRESWEFISRIMRPGKLVYL